MKRIARIKRTTLAVGMALLLSIVTPPPTSAAELQLSDLPLFIALGVEPNVVLTLDDSSSMNRCIITDEDTDKDWLEASSTGAMRAAGSPDINKLAYDPNVEYVIPDDGAGNPVGTPVFNNAWWDGYQQDPSEKTNLSSQWEPCRKQTSWIGNQEPAWYARWNGSDPTVETQIQDDSNYTVIPVGSAADTGGFGANATEKQRNFANWFSFYRYRYLAMKTVAARAFAHPDLDRRIRLAYSLMWGATDHCTTTGWPGSCGNGPYDKDKAGPISLMKKFEGTNRADFFSWLFATDTSGGTPLLMASRIWTAASGWPTP